MVNATQTGRQRFPIKAAARPVDRDTAGIGTVMGVDYSGAAESGKTAWLAELVIADTTVIADSADSLTTTQAPVFRLVNLAPLGHLAGRDDRDGVNEYLSDRIANRRQTFWGCDFPFGLPVELQIGGWADQLSHVSEFKGTAKDYGRALVALTERQLGLKHVRRTTDRETQTPFDCYHYRIIYQTFHGMRDVLSPISGHPQVAVLPFQFIKWASNRQASLVVEACPSSTLKRLGLPHQRYKQSGGKPPGTVHLRTRRTIMRTLCRYVEISPHRRRVIMQNSGGDALDAVLAGLGAWLGFSRADHRAIAAHPRYPREGYVYC